MSFCKLMIYVARYLANKASIASRIDCFSETPCSDFGEALKGQVVVNHVILFISSCDIKVEERLSFYETGDAPKKNLDVMRSVLESTSLKRKADDGGDSEEVKKKKKKKDSEEESEGRKEKKSKKGDKKKSKKSSKKEKKKKKSED